VCRDLERSAEVEEYFKDSKRTKLRRSSAFMHRPIVVRRRIKVGKPFGGFELEKLRKERISKNTDRS
jgi:hypothetical protein